jgi:hypothetical protein
MRVIILLVLATSAGVFFSRQEEDLAPRDGLAWTRLTLYWLFTIMISFEMVAGALWDLMKLEFVRMASAHLGYPEYMGTIIGVPRIPCALALLAPRFPRLKEWAYAGAFFIYMGAAASQYLTASGPKQWIPPLLFAAITIVSWALRPASRRLVQPTPAIKPGFAQWLVPVFITGVLLVVAYITIPGRTAPH